MRIGVLGGTFNPVHRGHLAVARAARDRHRLDRVLLVVSGRPPHKSEDLAPAADRLAMVRLALENEPALEASDIELRRAGPSYTVDTLRTLRERWPGATLRFIVGADSVGELRSWRRIADLARLAPLIIVNRPGYSPSLEPERFPEIEAELVSGWARDRVTMPPCDVSSSEVRRASRSGEDLRGRVPEAVARWLEEHRPYGG